MKIATARSSWWHFAIALGPEMKIVLFHLRRPGGCRALSTGDIPVWTMGQMLIVVNKESCMLLLQRRAEPRKRLHLYQPCAKRKHTWNLWPFHRRSPLLPATIDLPLVRPFEPSVKLQSHQARRCAPPDATTSLKARSRSHLIWLHGNECTPRDRVFRDSQLSSFWFECAIMGKKKGSVEFHRFVLKRE